MMSTLSTETDLVRLVAIVIVVACPLVGWWLAPRRRLASVLAAASVIPIALLTFTPTNRIAMQRCELSLDVHLLAPEPLANVALFIPFALLATVASRMPLAAAAAGMAGSALIEIVQAFAPSLGRSCDAGDWIANSVGTVTGVLLGVVALGLARWSRRGRRRRAEA